MNKVNKKYFKSSIVHKTSKFTERHKSFKKKLKSTWYFIIDKSLF
ncbi:hypothetical protein M153_5230005650 [Pseudoloma neurophilia]|uniref:Uncharacterized protein n=1 Tax=Pseudoloma neurophilia TaxID=146866 RepID=A0A0R0M5Y9_9MICR|nr:hypothetical protein M153_5230005650 [Pseudoloma neurophilia]